MISSLLSRRLNPRIHAAAALAIAGAALIVAKPDALGPALTGVVLVQIANFAFGAGQIFFKRTMAAHPDFKSLDVMALLFAGACVVTAAAAALTFDPDSFEITSTQALVLVYLGVVAAGLGFSDVEPRRHQGQRRCSGRNEQRVHTDCGLGRVVVAW